MSAQFMSESTLQTILIAAVLVLLIYMMWKQGLF